MPTAAISQQKMPGGGKGGARRASKWRGSTPSGTQMYVVKRSGKHERVSWDKISHRIERLSFGLSSHVDAFTVAQRVIAGFAPGMTTTEIDMAAAGCAAQLTNHHPDYAILAARLVICGLHARTTKKFSDLAEKLHAHRRPVTGEPRPLISDELLAVTRKHAETIDAAIIHNRDMGFTFFGFNTLQRSYLIKMANQVVESPQHMYMRVALGIHGDDIEAALETYDLLSQGVISHASPTMFNAGTPNGQLSSCFLLQMKDDSIEGIFDTLKDCAMVSKTAGGIGLALHKIRASGSFIAGTNGISNGLVPMLRVYNNTARYVDQGGNKRPGSIALYLEPWHADVFQWLDLRRNTGMEELRARDLFYALWVPDLFMRRVQAGGKWTLMCPKECPGLAEVYGAEFDALYERYEREGRGRRTFDAQELWFTIIEVQTETGTPYMLYKDAVNRRSTQQNVGTIQCSNLCVAGGTEVLTDKGWIPIIALTADHPQRAAIVAMHDDKRRTEERLAALEAKAEKKTSRNKKVPKALAEDIMAAKAALKSFDLPAIPAPGAAPVKVWNGEEWSEVLCAQTSEAPKRLIRITTSHGAQIDCTPEHKFILKDGVTRVDARELAMGTELVRTPPVEYPGDPAQAEDLDKAFRAGFLYGDITINHGAADAMLGPTLPPGCGAASFVVRHARCKPGWLKRLGYDADRARRGLPKEDHTKMAYIILPEDERKIRTVVTAPRDVRKAWCDGFIGGISERVHDIKGSRVLLVPVWSTLRSLGYDVHLVPAGSTGAWRITWAPKDDDSCPVVTGVQDVGAEEPTYCFTEPKRHAGCFGGQLTGQCAEIVQYTSKEEISSCLVGDTLITTDQGLRRIDECDGANVLVPFVDDGPTVSPMPRYVKAELIDNGVRDVYEISTNGAAVTATADHKFLTVTTGTHGKLSYKHAWKTVAELEAGDRIWAPRDIVVPGYEGPFDFDEDHATAGWLLGDGWQLYDTRYPGTGKMVYGACFGPTEETAKSVVIPTLQKWHSGVDVIEGGVDKSVKPYTAKNGVVNWMSSKKKFCQLIRDEYGLHPHKAIEKVIPDKIMFCKSPEQIASFIGGLFSADGTTTITKVGAKIALTSISRKLLEQTQTLLRCFGITGTIGWHHPKGRTNAQGNLNIHGPSSLRRFASVIGFNLCPAKQTKLVEHLRTFEWKMNKDVREYATVTKITHVGSQQVYDLSVPDGQHFIANGMVAHNCTLASVNLGRFVEVGDDGKPFYNFAGLHAATKVCTRNLNKIIDKNYCPLPEIARSNARHRSIAIGVQGLADTFAMMGLTWEEPLPEPVELVVDGIDFGLREVAPPAATRLLNQQIAETMYHAALEASCELAERDGWYESYPGSPMSRGLLQFDMAGVTPTELWDWAPLRAAIAKHGVRNAHLIGRMPTASTAQILGNNEGAEPFTSNMFTRQVLAGQYQVVNRHLIGRLCQLGLWNEAMRREVVRGRGSVQQIESIPADVRAVFKTVWEISHLTVLDLAADAGAFIDQTSSNNAHMAAPTAEQLTSMHFYGWARGLKTGMYYLRTKAGANAMQFTLDPENALVKASAGEAAAAAPAADAAAADTPLSEKELAAARLACSIENKEACMMCSA